MVYCLTTPHCPGQHSVLYTKVYVVRNAVSGCQDYKEMGGNILFVLHQWLPHKLLRDCPILLVCG